MVVITALLAVAGIESTKGQWAFATDVQKYYRCLPFDWYLVTKLDELFVPTRGDLVQFEAPKYVERFTETFQIIKIVAGVEGDTWRIENDRLYVNGELWGDLHLLEAIGQTEGSLDGEGVVPTGHVYVLGTNPSSYDSRYWGSLDVQQIKGKAHVIF